MANNLSNLGINLRTAALLTLGKACTHRMNPGNALRFRWIRDHADKLERDRYCDDGASYTTRREVEIDRDINLPRVVSETLRLPRNERGMIVWE